jgi:signal transduction histidine kinase
MSRLPAAAVATPYDQGVATAARADEPLNSAPVTPPPPATRSQSPTPSPPVTPAGTALRVLGAAALAYLALQDGAFSQGVAASVLVAVTVLSSFAVIALRTLGRDRDATRAAAVMLVLGAAVTPVIAGGYYYFLGVVVLLTWGRMTVRAAVALAAAAGVLLLALVTRDGFVADGLGGDRLGVLLAYGAGVLAAILFGINRHQAHERRRQERELVARSLELEHRSAELIAQTELTRSETARAAALEERSRIARDIHDLLAHSLGGLVRQLDAAEALLVERRDVDGAAGRLRVSRELAAEGLREARAVVGELRSTAPDPTGEPTPDLESAVRRLAYGPVGLQLGAELDVLGTPVPVPDDVADAFVAVVREGLTNAAKHSSADRVSLSLVFESSSVRLELANRADQPPDAQLAGSGSGVGLVGLAERMAAVGGALSAGREGSHWLLSAEWRTP